MFTYFACTEVHVRYYVIYSKRRKHGFLRPSAAFDYMWLYRGVRTLQRRIYLLSIEVGRYSHEVIRGYSNSKGYLVRTSKLFRCFHLTYNKATFARSYVASYSRSDPTPHVLWIMWALTLNIVELQQCLWG